MPRSHWPRLLSWPRLKLVLVFVVIAGLLPDILFNGGEPLMLIRITILCLAALLAFGLLEQWPRHLSPQLPRWTLQVLGVAMAMPLTTALLWQLSTATGAPAFWNDNDRLVGFGFMTALALLLAPWTALAALVRQKEAFARNQALAFDLERSELERQALDARLHLLRAQVAPHFLFNTLANVQALVDSNSPQASTVLHSLVAYLRAAVPRLHDTATTIGQETQLVQAYLELMQMRMPDRLHYTVQVDDAARARSCPPMTLLTLVENAVRHGIDPSEQGGRIDVLVTETNARCRVQVSDTGIGLQQHTAGAGTGLSSLSERLQLSFAEDAHLTLTEQTPHGVRVELDFPAQDAIHV